MLGDPSPRISRLAKVRRARQDLRECRSEVRQPACSERSRQRPEPKKIYLQRFAMILTHAVLLLTCRTQRELLSSQTSLPNNLNASTQCLVGQLHCKALYVTPSAILITTKMTVNAPHSTSTHPTARSDRRCATPSRSSPSNTTPRLKAVAPVPSSPTALRRRGHLRTIAPPPPLPAPCQPHLHSSHPAHPTLPTLLARGLLFSETHVQSTAIGREKELRVALAWGTDYRFTKLLCSM